jgi:hypothetical protein
MWDPTRKKLVRRLLQEQDKVLRSYLAQKGGTRSKGGDRASARAGNMSNGTCMREDGARGPWTRDQILINKWGAWKLGFCLLFSLVLLSLLSLS